MFVINDCLGVYGGSVTLIERLCTYLKQINEQVAVYTNSILNSEIVTKLDNLNIKIRCFNTNYINDLRKNLEKDSKNSKVIVLNFLFNNYVNVEIVKAKTNISISNILYCIHPRTFFKASRIPYVIPRYFIQSYYKNLINRVIIDGQVIFMDQDCIDETKNFYKDSLSATATIQALPMICKDLDEDTINSKIYCSYQKRNIITACRAEFPFKGYVFGLIEIYEILYKKYKNLTLSIVCDGAKENVDKVRSKVFSLDTETRNTIKLYSWMNYQDLKELIKKSYLFVGMGTGVLDSALLYVPSIAVKYDTYDCLSDCAFYENPTSLTSNTECKSNAIKVIDKILALDKDEYSNISRLSFKRAKENYDISTFVKLLKSKKNYNCELSTIDRFIHFFNIYLTKKLNRH